MIATVISLSLVLVVILFAVLAVAAIVAAKILPAKAAPASNLADYQLRPAILSAAERSFAGVLGGALPDGVTWFAKVRVGDIFTIRNGVPFARATGARNRINQKHVDFLLVRTADFAPVAGLELDDSSHQQDRRKTRDAFVDAVFKSAGLPLLHIPAKAAYNPAELRQKIAAALADAAPATAPAAVAA